MNSMNSENNGALVPTAPAGVVARQEFAATQMIKQAEIAATAVAAQVRAEVEARYVVAMQRPRDLDDVRQRILKECKRPGFAEMARYSKPMGGENIEGWTVRFAEMTARCYGNMIIDRGTAIYDDDKVRVFKVSVCDPEANLYESQNITVEKTVERRYLKKNQKPIRSRINSYGDTVHIVEATDDEIWSKANALGSKARRNMILSLIPGDFLDDALATVTQTLNNQAAVDPDAERKRIADGFAELNVAPSDLKLWLGHDLDKSTPAELVALRKVFAAVKAGETTWIEILEQREAERKTKGEAEKSAAAPIDTAAPAKNLTDLKKKEAAKKAEPPKGIKTSVEEEDGKRRPVADMADTGPCGWTDDEQGEACDREGPKYDGIGWRCKQHTPEVKA